MSGLAFGRSSPNRLLVASWDKFLYAYDVSGSPDATQLVKKYEHRAPVLDVSFGDTDEVAYTAGMDWVVNQVDLNTGELTALSKHAAPVRCVAYSPEYSMDYKPLYETRPWHLTDSVP